MWRAPFWLFVVLCVLASIGGLLWFISLDEDTQRWVMVPAVVFFGLWGVHHRFDELKNELEAIRRRLPPPPYDED